MRVDTFLVADDHAIVRAGLKTVMKDLHPFSHGDDAVNGDQVIALVKKNNYDIIILDVNMPDTDCIAMISNILAYKDKSRILIFSMKSEELYAKRFLKLGVLGYLDKESNAEEIKKAISNVLTGHLYVSPNLKKHFYEDMMSKRADNPFEKLSNRYRLPNIFCWVILMQKSKKHSTFTPQRLGPTGSGSLKSSK